MPENDLKKTKQDLSKMPIQPLYSQLKSWPREQVMETLPLLSKEQRQVFLDLDFWQKDCLDLPNFEWWIPAYTNCKDSKTLMEFASGPQFLLYLKSRFVIYTFDAEAPVYPDHDYYFLTDDSLLLFEFDEGYPYAEEIRLLVRRLYEDWGVEKAYVYLFKMVSDSTLSLQEEEYKRQVGQLADYGFMNYYEALELLTPYPSLDLMKKSLKNKEMASVKLDTLSKRQCLSKDLIKVYQQGNNLLNSLEQVKCPERKAFLEFTFYRTVNGSLALKHAMKEGSVAIQKINQQTKQVLLLGLSYLDNHCPDEVVPFDQYDFYDLYRIGKTLTTLVQRDLEKNLKDPFFQEQTSFIGTFWENFLKESFASTPFLQEGQLREELSSWETYVRWESLSKTFIKSTPFILMLGKRLQELVEEGDLQDAFYCNYSVEMIDYESLLLSYYAQFVLGGYSNDPLPIGKLGLTWKEFLSFTDKIIVEKRLIPAPELAGSIQDFLKKFGLGNIKGKVGYFYYLLHEHLMGYKFEDIAPEDRKHLGGPIILNA